MQLTNQTIFQPLRLTTYKTQNFTLLSDQLINFIFISKPQVNSLSFHSLVFLAELFSDKAMESLV